MLMKEKIIDNNTKLYRSSVGNNYYVSLTN